MTTPAQRTTHEVTVLKKADSYAVEPERVEAYPRDWVKWTWSFPTSHAEVYLCKGFYLDDTIEENMQRFPNAESGPGQGPGGACLLETDQSPAVLTTPIRLGVPFGTYHYTVAFLTEDGEEVILDPELIVKPKQ